MAGFHIPEHVHESSAPHGGTVLLDARTGQWYAMNATACALWSEWRLSGDFDAGVRTVAARFPRRSVSEYARTPVNWPAYCSSAVSSVRRRTRTGPRGPPARRDGTAAGRRPLLAMSGPPRRPVS